MITIEKLMSIDKNYLQEASKAIEKNDLSQLVPYKNHLQFKIADRLMSVNISDVKETMRKLILCDILEVLAEIRKYQTTDEIENYIFHALSGRILDKKAKKQIESIL